MSLATSLTRLGLDHRLTWCEVERLLQLAQVDADQAVADVEFADWFENHPQRTARAKAIYEMLKPRNDQYLKVQPWKG